MFYGNRTNTTHTAFQFDKIYTSRYAMEDGMQRDGIAPGRFVLVSYGYDEDLNSIGVISSDYRVAYSDNQDQTISPTTYDDLILYADAQCTKPFIYTNYEVVENPATEDIEKYYIRKNGFYYKVGSFVEHETYYKMTSDHVLASTNGITQGEIVHRRCNVITTGDDINNPTPLAYTDDFYECVGPYNDSNPDVAKFRPLFLYSSQTDENNESHIDDYFKRYTFDLKHYKDIDDTWGILYRGYDSTVWEKVVGEGNERYVLIAHLNPVTPGIAVVAEPPTDEPIAPFQGADSLDGFYKLHVQSPWGFRVKSAEEGELSDEKIKQKTCFYSLGTYTTDEEEVDGAIYYNKSGFDKAIRTYDETTPNKIAVTPTGKSSNFEARYKDSQFIQDDQASADMQELSINLPAIGNAISDVYDLMYGIGDPDEHKRALDIKWYSASAKKYVDYGDAAVGGKTRNLSTLAGTINVMHDRLGQIIVINRDDESPPGSQEIEIYWDDDKIYYYELLDKYFYKGKAFTYNRFQIFYEPITLTAQTWRPLVYYKVVSTRAEADVTLDGNIYLVCDRSNIFDSEATYYRKYQDLSNAGYTPVQLAPYIRNKYWKRIGTDYERETAEIPEAESHYLDLTLSKPMTFDYSYTPNTYYNRSPNGDILLVTDEIPNMTKTYYTISETHNFPGPDGTGYIYKPNIYYYYEDEGVINPPLDLRKETREVPDYTKSYYYLELEQTLTPVLTDQGTYVIGYHIKRKIPVSFTPDTLYSPYHFYDEATGNYYRVTEEWLSQQPASFFESAQRFQEVILTSIMDSLFIDNKYYFYKNANTLSIATANDFSPITEYYTIANAEVIPYFYVRNYYYWRQDVNGVYTLDSSLEMREDGQYAIKQSCVIIDDVLNEYTRGYPWDVKAVDETIPWPITLGNETSNYAALELTGIVNGSNTINGLLLQLYQLLGAHYPNNRDDDNITGLMNQTRDTLRKVQTELEDIEYRKQFI